MAAGDIRLIVTDLDGTLLGHVNDVRMLAVFRERLEALRAERGTRWTVCTGRSLRSFRQIFGPIQMLNLWPDYVVVHHAFIYSVEPDKRLRPHRIWNWRVRWRLWTDQLNVRRSIRDWEKLISVGRRGVQTLKRDRRRLWLKFETQDMALWAAGFLEDKARVFRHLKVFRYQREVDVRAVPFTKGLAVAELARHVDVMPDHILAIGDGYNDISMLDPSVAAMRGCPANAAPEILEHVHSVGGHIARAPSLEGVVEILDAHLNGTVCSDLPARWVPPAEMANPNPPKAPKKKRRNFRKLAKPLLLAACLFTVYVVLASYFRKMPFAKPLMRPYERFAAWVIGHQKP